MKSGTEEEIGGQQSFKHGEFEVPKVSPVRWSLVPRKEIWAAKLNRRGTTFHMNMEGK